LKITPSKGPSYADASPPPYLRTETDLVFKTLYHFFLEKTEEEEAREKKLSFFIKIIF
jgi:hypothetical protein